MAWSGESFDGGVFAGDAVERGAVAMLAEACSSSPLPCLSTPEPRRLLGALASRLYQSPDRELTLVGVTGTNGKTTVVSLVAAMLDAANRPAARFGTLGNRFRDLEFSGDRTTPEASDLFRMLRTARQQGAASAVMEVSSHALEQGRVSCASFDVGVFLNLTRDHLDFHGEMDTYFEAKAALFRQLKDEGRAVVNIDDPRGPALAASCSDVVTFGEQGDVRFERVAISARRHSRVSWPARSARSSLPRRWSATTTPSNILAAAAIGVACGLTADEIAGGLAGHAPLPGRMELVDCGQPFPVIVDYAHTDGALRAALTSMRSFEAERVLVVMGCGGERDEGKRPLMGRAATELADYSILTSDNPRGEDPVAILKTVEEGARSVPGARYEVLADRREAIRRAMAIAGPGWSVLIAGKGHERFQDVGDTRIPFVDRDEVEKALEVGFGSAPID